MTETSKHDLCLFMLPRLIPDASLEVLHSFKAAEHWSFSDKLEELDLLWTVWPLWHQAMKQRYYLELNFLACYICCLYHSMGSVQVYKRCLCHICFSSCIWAARMISSVCLWWRHTAPSGVSNTALPERWISSQNTWPINYIYTKYESREDGRSFYHRILQKEKC